MEQLRPIYFSVFHTNDHDRLSCRVFKDTLNRNNSKYLFLLLAPPWWRILTVFSDQVVTGKSQIAWKYMYITPLLEIC